MKIPIKVLAPCQHPFKIPVFPEDVKNLFFCEHCREFVAYRNHKLIILRSNKRATTEETNIE